MGVPEQHRGRALEGLRFAVLTVSDTRTEESDVSGRRIRELAAAAGHSAAPARIVPDEPERIRAAARELLAGEGVDVLVVTGGTGLGPRDRTPEAIEELFERRIDGFGELFRLLSYEEIGAAAMLGRAVAGVVGGQAVFVLPGAPDAAALGMERLILPEAGHLLAQLRQAR